MIKKLKRFLPDIAGAAGGSPVEIFVIFLFSVYAVLMVEGVADGDRGYLALYPLSLSLSFLFNLWFRGKRLRFIYFLSALLPLSMAGCDLSGFVDSVAYPVSLMLCILMIFASKWRRDNIRYVKEGLFYVKNCVSALIIAGMTFGLTVAIYFSVRYIFPVQGLSDAESAGNMANAVLYFLIFSFMMLCPLLFLIFHRSEKGAWSSGRLDEIAVNYVVTPALLLYTCILYIYFAKILFTWSLPKGGIAYMVFAFTIIAILSQALRLTLKRKGLFEWFYGNFCVISLPALAMFWIGVWYRIAEYGFTQARVYLVVCGTIMTVTVLFSLSRRFGKYVYANLLAIILFALFTYVPGISAEDIERRSQMNRSLSADNGAVLAEEETVVTDAPWLYIVPKGEAVDLEGYSSLYKISDAEADGGYFVPYGSSAGDTLRLISPSGETLLNMSYGNFLSAQLKKAGLSGKSPDDSLAMHGSELLVYDFGEGRILFNMLILERERDSMLKVNTVTADLFLCR